MRDVDHAILKYLGSRETWATSFAISAFMNVSVRSVKSYLRDLSEEFPGLVESSREGFRVTDKKRLSEILSGGENHLPQTAEDRKKFLFQRLLLEDGSRELDMLASELCISPVTLTNELGRLKAELGDYELTLKTKNNILSIVGPEANKRKLMSLLVYADSKESFLSVKRMQTYLPHYDLAVVKEIVTQALHTHHFFMDEFSLLNLVLHIAITMERKRVQDDGDWRANEGLKVGSHIYAIAQGITEEVSARFQVTFTPAEVLDFALLILTRAIADNVNTLGQEDLADYVGEDVMELVRLIQRRTKEVYNISISNEDFLVRFSLHIKNLLIRLRGGILLHNPQMVDIKNTYPFIYDVSVFIAGLIALETNLTLSEDEIAYIALHIGVLIEERKVIKQEVRAVLVHPEYFRDRYDLQDLARRCAALFETSLLITGVCSSPDELDGYSDYDLVISTVRLGDYFATPWVQISSMLTSRDVQAISSKVNEILLDRTKSKVESKLRFLFREELFFVGAPFKDGDNAIRTMGGAVETGGWADGRFVERLFEREAISASSYANIAMPHPLEMCARTSVIAVSLHPSPIPWGMNRVNIVFLLAINPVDRLLFKDIFDFVTEVVAEEKKLKTLLLCKTYGEFIATLVSYAK